MGGSVKRQKLVTQNEVLVRNFNLSCTVKEKEETAFKIGLKPPSKPVVNLRRLMCTNESDASRLAYK